MTNYTTIFSEKEIKNIKTLGHILRGINTPLAEEAENCKNAFRRRKKEQLNFGQTTVHCLAVAYRAFLRCENDKENQQAFMGALGLAETPKTSAKRLNTVIKASVTKDRKYASKLATIIKFALQRKISADELEKFIDKYGGIAKCIRAYLNKSADDDSSERSDAVSNDTAIESIIVEVLDEELVATIKRVKADVKKFDVGKTKTAKLRFSRTGKVFLISLKDLSPKTPIPVESLTTH